MELLANSPIVQQHLGWCPTGPPLTGSIRCHGRKRREIAVIHTANTQAFRAQNCDNFQSVLVPGATWYPAIEVVTQSGDSGTVGSWAVIRLNENDHFIGQIVEILSSSNTLRATTGIVTVEKFVVGSERHHYLGMPVLFPLVPAERTLIVATTQTLQFIFNVQHDCGACGCGPTGTRQRRVERELSTQTEPVIEHTEERKFIINTHALHNASKIRQYLPRELTAPISLVPDRVKHHQEISSSVRTAQKEKREQTKAKQAATRAKNKKAKQQAAQQHTNSSQPANLPTLPPPSQPVPVSSAFDMFMEPSTRENQLMNMISPPSQSLQPQNSDRGQKRRRGDNEATV